MNENKKSRGISLMSVISLAVAILGIVLYGQVFKNPGLTAVFVIVSLVSVVLPPVAKAGRVKTGKSGGWCEIPAIVLGGFNFYCICFISPIPMFIGYLGWVFCTIAYRMIKLPKSEYKKEEGLASIGDTDPNV